MDYIRMLDLINGKIYGNIHIMYPVIRYRNVLLLRERKLNGMNI